MALFIAKRQPATSGTLSPIWGRRGVAFEEYDILISVFVNPKGTQGAGPSTKTETRVGTDIQVLRTMSRTSGSGPVCLDRSNAYLGGPCILRAGNPTPPVINFLKPLVRPRQPVRTMPAPLEWATLPAGSWVDNPARPCCPDREEHARLVG